MKLKLIKLEVENFKKIKKFSLDLDGKSAVVTGKNATGKTTLIDAWSWLLTGSNSDQQSNFNAIELDDHGNVIDNQDAVVRATIMSDKKKIELRKEFKQKWQKKRGAAEAILIGTTTKHYWNDVYISLTEYNKRLETLAPIKILRTISDVRQFCERMKWNDRRQILIDLTGNVSVSEICEKYDELKDFPSLLEERSLDDFEKILKQKKKLANEQLKELPGRIDELRKMVPDTSELDEVALRNEQKSLDEKISEKKNELVAMSNDAAKNKLRAKRDELKSKKAHIEIEVREEMAEKSRELHDEQLRLNRLIRNICDDIETLTSRNEALKASIYKNAQDRERLYQEYIATDKESESKICYACGQILPYEIVEQNKQSRLGDIEKKGRDLKQENIKLVSEKDDVDKRLSAAHEAEKETEEKIERHNAETKSFGNKWNDIIIERQEPIEKEIKEICAKINEPNIAQQDERDEISKEIGELTSQYERVRSKIASIAQLDSVNRRIKEREKDLQQVVEQLEDAERSLYLIEIFCHKRAEYLESRVNDFFELTTWKLFEIQKNEGIKEVCEPTFKGVPYSTDLNTGARINLGLDCIKTLSKHYDLELPIFIDNAESVTNWQIDLDQQVVKLVASANIDKLEVIDENS